MTETKNVYIGQRYVPKIMGEWDKTISYEGLSIVTNEGNSYTSKKRVPIGVELSNEEFWTVTGNYNAQVELYRQEVLQAQKDFSDGLLDNIELIKERTPFVMISDYQSIIEDGDITLALKQALLDVTAGGCILFDPKQTYSISDNITITKPVVIDFNHSTIHPKVSDKGIFDINYHNEHDFKTRVKLVNYFFKGLTGFVPTYIIKNNTINSVFHGQFNQCKTSHSLIWNNKGYGVKITGEMRHNDTPRIIYITHLINETIGYTYDFDVDVDITTTTGIGIEADGGTGNIKGIIENCEKGGYYFNGTGRSNGISIYSHFEGNKLFDIQLGTNETLETNPNNTGVTNIINAYFNLPYNDGSNKSILFGSNQLINIIGAKLSAGLKPIDTTVRNTSINDVGHFGTPYMVIDPIHAKINVLGQKGITRNAHTITNELVLYSPNGKQWSFKVGDDGLLNGSTLKGNETWIE